MGYAKPVPFAIPVPVKSEPLIWTPLADQNPNNSWPRPYNLVLTYYKIRYERVYADRQAVNEQLGFTPIKT